MLKMSSEYLTRSYLNKPEKTSLYENIANLIKGSHSDPKEDLEVLEDIHRDLMKFIDSI